MHRPFFKNNEETLMRTCYLCKEEIRDSETPVTTTAPLLNKLFTVTLHIHEVCATYLVHNLGGRYTRARIANG